MWGNDRNGLRLLALFPPRTHTVGTQIALLFMTGGVYRLPTIIKASWT